MGKTYVACRPGFKQAAEAAFSGMEIEVDDDLDKDYEFRQRELGLADLLEAELENEEEAAARKADPKNAHTLVVPLLNEDEDLDDNPVHLHFLVVRIDRKDDKYAAQALISKVKPVMSDDIVNTKATTTALRNELKREGFNVHSISLAQGMTLLG